MTNGQVISVKEDLSLVIGNIGSLQGVKVGMPFMIQRGNHLVARARVVDVREKISGVIIEEYGSNTEKVKVGDTMHVDVQGLAPQSKNHGSSNIHFMEVLSVYRGARMSAFKVRELTREIQGPAGVGGARSSRFPVPRKSAVFVGKTLKSAIANAENNNELKVDTLVVKEATVGEGPTMRRMKSRARGSSSAIRKRTSHIRIDLSDEIELPQRASVAKAANKKKSAALKPAPKVVAPKAAPAPVETEAHAAPRYPSRRRSG